MTVSDLPVEGLRPWPVLATHPGDRATRAGLSYDQIALEVGYANRGTAHNVVTQALPPGRPTALTRCGAWNWPAWRPPTPPCGHKPCRGMSPSVTALLRILDLECRLQGLYEPPAMGAKGPRTTGTTARDHPLS